MQHTLYSSLCTIISRVEQTLGILHSESELELSLTRKSALRQHSFYFHESQRHRGNLSADQDRVYVRPPKLSLIFGFCDINNGHYRMLDIQRITENPHLLFTTFIAQLQLESKVAEIILEKEMYSDNYRFSATLSLASVGEYGKAVRLLRKSLQNATYSGMAESIDILVQFLAVTPAKTLRLVHSEQAKFKYSTRASAIEVLS
jgi:hypothetical protein